MLTTVHQSPHDEQVLHDLFRVRHDMFVDGRGWEGLRRPDGLDRDAYDDDDTVYFITRDEEGAIVGGARLRPSVLPHMLASEKFAGLCDWYPVPIGKHVFECSRTFVARRHPKRRQIFAQLLWTIASWCVEHDVNTLTGVLETWWLRSYQDVGLTAQPLGLPHLHVEESGRAMTLLAVAFAVDAGVRDRLRHSGFGLMEEA